jgi:hypothetical protein
LVCAPGLTIKDRLRVLQPNDPDSYYTSRELVPGDMLDEVNRAKIVITNYHAFRLRERIEVSKGGRQLLEGRGWRFGGLGFLPRLRADFDQRADRRWTPYRSRHHWQREQPPDFSRNRAGRGAHIREHPHDAPSL